MRMIEQTVEAQSIGNLLKFSTVLMLISENHDLNTAQWMSLDDDVFKFFKIKKRRVKSTHGWFCGISSLMFQV